MFISEKEQIRNYWNGRANAYAHEYGHGFSHHSEPDLWLSLLKRNLTVKPGADALDLGTGPGFMALVLDRLGLQVTGLDVSEKMLKIAGGNAARNGAAVKFMQGDAENPPFEDESFELILCRHLTWTLTDLKKTLAIWKRLLKPQGVLTIIDGIWGATTPQARLRKLVADAFRAVKHKRWPKDWRRSYVSDVKVLPHINGLLPQTLIETMAFCGFENIRHDDLRDVVRHERRFAPLEYKIRYGGAPRYLITGTSVLREEV